MIDLQKINPLSLPSVAVEDRKKLPEVPSIYFAIDGNNQIQYIGRSVNPRQRWASHHRIGQVQECRIACMECDPSLLNEVERALIEYFDPPLNGLIAPKNTDKKKISAYPPDALKRDAEALAELEKRSLSNLIEVLLQRAVNQAKSDGRLK